MPYGWDRKIDSLAATIYNERPDLFTEKPQGEPIPLSPAPSEYTKNLSPSNKKSQCCCFY